LSLAGLLLGVVVFVEAARSEVHGRGASALAMSSAGLARLPPADREREHFVGSVDSERELSSIMEFVETVDPEEPMSLSHIRTVLYHFERARADVLGRCSLRGDSRYRDHVREILRMLRTKIEALTRLAKEKEAAGEVDDGGEIPPTLRINICTGFVHAVIDDDTTAQVEALCRALDQVRAAVMAGEGEEEAVCAVNGRVIKLQGMNGFQAPGVPHAMAEVLEEEYRWVTKRLARRPAPPEAREDGAPPDVTETVASMVGYWMDHVSAGVANPSMSEAKVELFHQFDVVSAIDLENRTSLRKIRTNLHILRTCKETAAKLVKRTAPDSLQHLRDLLRQIKEKSAALEAQAKQREAEGEVDEVSVYPASQRASVCRNLDKYDVAPGERDQLARICKSLDTLRAAALAGADTDTLHMGLIGRFDYLAHMPGFQERPAAFEIVDLFIDEERWLANYLDSKKALSAPPDDAPA